MLARLGANRAFSLGWWNTDRPQGAVSSISIQSDPEMAAPKTGRHRPLPRRAERSGCVHRLGESAALRHPLDESHRGAARFGWPLF